MAIGIEEEWVAYYWSYMLRGHDVDQDGKIDKDEFIAFVKEDRASWHCVRNVFRGAGVTVRVHRSTGIKTTAWYVLKALCIPTLTN